MVLRTPPATKLPQAPELIVRAPRRQAMGEAVREPLTPIYYPAGRDLAVDGRDSPRRICGLYSATRLGTARGGLPHNSGGDVLPRGQSRCGGFRSNGATREAVWSGSGPQPDDVDEFRRQLGDCSAVFARAQY